MADNYLEKRYEEVFGQGKTKVKKVGHTLDELLLKNRSCRGYNKSFVVSEDMLRRIVQVNTRIASGCNRQVLRYRLVTQGSESVAVLKSVKMGAALPELHLPFPDTEPEAFIVVCCEGAENKLVDIDLGISLQSMTLKVTEMGLSSLIIGAFNKETIKEALSLELEPLAILAVGKGVEKFELVPISKEESHAYYRNNGVHYIPKVRLEDLIVVKD